MVKPLFEAVVSTFIECGCIFVCELWCLEFLAAIDVMLMCIMDVARVFMILS